jgi:hypothetical protein
VSGPNTDFSWTSDRDKDAIVLGMQQAIAVYLNGDGAVVVRQEGHPYDDEDEIIVIQPQNAGAVADAIMDAAELSKQLTKQAPEPVRLVQHRAVGGDREPVLPLAEAAE